MAKKKIAKRRHGQVPAGRVLRVPVELVEAAKLTQQKRFVQARDPPL